MEGSCCVAALEAVPARDVPHPLSPAPWGEAGHCRWGARQELQGAGGNPSGMVLLRPWCGWRDIWEGEMGRAIIKGQRAHVVSSQSNGGIYCCLGVREGRCRLILDREEIL